MAKAGIQAVRGMNDGLPDVLPAWHRLESELLALANAYGYSEIRFPVIENTLLFKRTIGEVTDIVEKEMYTFEDKNGDSLTMRPEGTAGCVRAAMQHGLLYNQQQKLWYMGPMFRHERPQKGRYRQFHQFGVEAFGIEGPDVDAEQIAMTARLWRALGISEHVTLHLNTLGSPEDRVAYKQALTEYCKAHIGSLDADSVRRLDSNPLRILDSKNPDMASLIDNAPKMSEYIGESSLQHFAELRQMLDTLGVDYVWDERLVRGLDYYGKTVYEWTTNLLGAQNAICGGGRYDGLVEHLGGQATPGIGFAIGLERLVAVMEEAGFQPTPENSLYMVSVGEEARRYALALSERLRTELPKVQILLHTGQGSFKSQMKKADKSSADIALLIGEDELSAQEVTLKMLREQSPQIRYAEADLMKVLAERFSAE